MYALICSYLVFKLYRWRIFPKRKLCKYFGDRALVSQGIILDIKELLCKRLAGGELKWSSFMETWVVTRQPYNGREGKLLP
jgi:hypothetical protein